MVTIVSNNVLTTNPKIIYIAASKNTVETIMHNTENPVVNTCFFIRVPPMPQASIALSSIFDKGYKGNAVLHVKSSDVVI